MKGLDQNNERPLSWLWEMIYRYAYDGVLGKTTTLELDTLITPSTVYKISGEGDDLAISIIERPTRPEGRQ